MQFPLSSLILLATASVAIVVGQFFRVRIRPVWGLLGFLIATLGANLPVADPLISVQQPPIQSAFIDDGLARSEHWIVIVFGLLAAVAIVDNLTDDVALTTFGFLLFVIAGLLLVVHSNDLISLGLSFEIIHRALDGLLQRLAAGQSPMPDDSGRHNGTTSWSRGLESGLYWLGAAMLGCLTATTNFAGIRRVLQFAYDPGADRIPIGAPSKMILLSVGLIVVALLAQLRLVPFRLSLKTRRHDPGNNFEWTRSMSLQLAASAALIRLLGLTFVGLNPPLTTLMMTICLVNLFVGGVMAIRCLSPDVHSIPTWLTCTAMVQSVWLLVELMVVSLESGQPEFSWSTFDPGHNTLAICVLIQMSNLLAFGGIHWTLDHLHRGDRPILYMEDLRGCIQTKPISAISLLVAIASSVGMPLTLGFWSRWFTLLSGSNVHLKDGASILVPHAGLRLTMTAAVLSNAIIAIVAIRMVREIALEPPLARPSSAGGRGSLISGALAAGLILAAGLSFQVAFIPLNSIAASAIKSPESTLEASPVGASSKNN